MCLLFETIRIEGRQLHNMAFHNERFNRSRRELYGITRPLSLEGLIIMPADLSPEKTKCRMVYSREIHSINFSAYVRREIHTLQIVEDNDSAYAYKYLDRQAIEKLKQSIKADDILIVRNGFITDTSFANIVFWDGINWITPSSPLLHGTMRSKLLQEGKIRCGEIKKTDLRLFKSARIINAMIGLEEGPPIAIRNIR